MSYIRSVLVIAARNLNRQLLRSMATGSVIVITTVAVMIALAVHNGIDRQMTFAVTGTLCGDIEIVHETETISRHVESLLNDIDGISYSSARVSLSGTITGADGSAIVDIVGIDPVTETRLTENLQAKQGTDVATLSRNQLAVSSTIADRLNISAGDEAIITVQTDSGAVHIAELTIATIFSPLASPGWIETTVYMPLDSAQELAGLTDDRVTSILVFLTSPDRAAPVLTEITGRVAPHRGIKAIPWQDGRFSVVRLSMQVVSALTAIMGSVLMIMTGAVLLTTMMMAVVERRQELGVLAALGAGRSRLLVMLTAEALALQTIATITGIALSSLIVVWLGNTGIPATSDQLVQMFGGENLYPVLEIKDAFLPLLGLNLIAVITTIAGAFNITGSQPVELMVRQ